MLLYAVQVFPRLDISLGRGNVRQKRNERRNQMKRIADESFPGADPRGTDRCQADLTARFSERRNLIPA